MNQEQRVLWLFMIGVTLIVIFLYEELGGTHNFTTGLALGSGILLVLSGFEEYKRIEV